MGPWLLPVCQLPLQIVSNIWQLTPPYSSKKPQNSTHGDKALICFIDICFRLFKGDLFAFCFLSFMYYYRVPLIACCGRTWIVQSRLQIFGSYRLQILSEQIIAWSSWGLDVVLNARLLNFGPVMSVKISFLTCLTIADILVQLSICDFAYCWQKASQYSNWLCLLTILENLGRSYAGY